jgi:hypothetical protein
LNLQVGDKVDALWEGEEVEWRDGRIVDVKVVNGKLSHYRVRWEEEEKSGQFYNSDMTPSQV